MSSPWFFSYLSWGSFENHEGRVVYAEGECTIKCLDTDLISLDDLKLEVSEMGYSKERIKQLYYKKSDVEPEENIMARRQ